MSVKRKPKEKKCSVCYSWLPPENTAMGCCDLCVAKRIKQLKGRMVRGAVIGAALVAVYALFIYYAGHNHYISQAMPYKGDVVLPFFWGEVTMSSRILGLLNQSIPAHLLVGAILFILPFGAFIKLGVQTFRHDSQEHAAKLDPFAGRMIAGAQHHRMDDIGLFVISALLFLLSGPFYFVYRLYKIARLSAHLRLLEKEL